MREEAPSPEPEDYSPALTWRANAWRYVAALCISASTFESFIYYLDAGDTFRLWLWFLLGVASFVLIHWRRRYPLAVAIITALCSGWSGLASGPACLALVSAVARRKPAEVVAVAVVWLALIPVDIVAGFDSGEPLWVTVPASLLLTGGLISFGLFIGSRRELFWTLEQRAIRAEAEQDLRADQARSHERARIAREMHDVVAHRISQVSMHAGAVAFRQDLDADEMRRELATIQTAANSALHELRDVLGVLRADDSSRAVEPQPTLSDLVALADDAREGGLRLRLQLPEQPPQLADVLGRTLYRIVQEGITNASRHAPHSKVDVQVDFTETHAYLRMHNPKGFGAPHSDGAGLGLIGVRERVDLASGTMDVRDTLATFTVEIWLPLAP